MQHMSGCVFFFFLQSLWVKQSVYIFEKTLHLQRATQELWGESRHWNIQDVTVCGCCFSAAAAAAKIQHRTVCEMYKTPQTHLSQSNIWINFLACNPIKCWTIRLFIIFFGFTTGYCQRWHLDWLVDLSVKDLHLLLHKEMPP